MQKTKEKPVTYFLNSICLILYSIRMETRIELLFIIYIDCKYIVIRNISAHNQNSQYSSFYVSVVRI